MQLVILEEECELRIRTAREGKGGKGRKRTGVLEQKGKGEGVLTNEKHTAQCPRRPWPENVAGIEGKMELWDV